MLHCRDCERYYKMKNEEHGVCSVPASYFPTEADNECVYLKQMKKVCGNCSHFGSDFACMTQDENDVACSGFTDILDDEITNILLKMLMNGDYSRERLRNLCIMFEQSSEYQFITAHMDKKENNE